MDITAMIFGALVAGLLCGAVPMWAGQSRGRAGLATTGFLCCIVAALVGGLVLAAPTAALFTWRCLRSDAHDHVRTSSEVA
jgi:hypothetical protein